MSTIAHPCLEVQTAEVSEPAVPPWFAETILLAQSLRAHGLLAALATQVRLVRGRFGQYEALDFLALVFGYAISGERTLQAYFERLAPFAAPFMALFERGALPHRATLSRFLAAVDGPCVDALRAVFVSSSFTWGWTPQTIGGLWDRAGRRHLVFDIDGTREAARQRALAQGPALPPPRRRLDAVCAPGYTGRRRGEVVRTRTTVLQMHTRQWLGTFGGKGNGDSRGELAAALQAVKAYLEAWDLPLAAGIVRVDGQYGDPAVVAQIRAAGPHVVVRGRAYALLEQPQVQAVLAQSAPLTLTPPESQTTYEVFDLPDVPLAPAQRDAVRGRVILTRHAWEGGPIAVGKLVGTWVYELFLTTLPADGFLATDVLDLYHGRGAFEGTLADEDVEGDPDRWCSHSPAGQELWQVVWQWVWNLRLALGQRVVDAPPRASEWAPAQTAAPPPVAVPLDQPAEAYGPWQWARARGRATGRLGADTFTPRADGQVQCPAGALLRPTETRQEAADTQRRVFSARAADCRGCAVRAACLGPGASGARARRVSARRRRLVPMAVTTDRPTPYAAMAWTDVAGRRLRRTWMTHWQRQAVTITALPARLAPLAPPPRAGRAHRRLGWDERFSRNARAPLPLATLHVAGVPQRVVEALREGGQPTTR